jgi:hypothetical protein
LGEQWTSSLWAIGLSALPRYRHDGRDAASALVIGDFRLISCAALGGLSKGAANPFAARKSAYLIRTMCDAH